MNNPTHLDLYHITKWSEGYFNTNAQGELIVQPYPNRPAVSLAVLVKKIVDSGLSLPVLIRFTDILKQRVYQLYDAFSQAQKKQNYQGGYTALYPIKVNQQKSVVQNIYDNGKYPVGLEVGSKTELLAVIGFARPHHAMVLCNGYKDQEYIRLALMAQRLGHPILIVVEKFSDLPRILTIADELQVTPLLGVRVRLNSISAGNWQNTGGAKAKFGLTTYQVVALIAHLKNKNKLNCLRLLHVHMGSQIADLTDIENGLQEMARFYAQLRTMGAAIDYVDVGGGLGVDYEGTASKAPCSISYTVEDYADMIVQVFCKICQTYQLPHPHILTESGRAMTAHHAVLITNVIDLEKVTQFEKPPVLPHECELLTRMRSLLESVTSHQAKSAFEKLECFYEMALHDYIAGNISLEERAHLDKLYFLICQKIKTMLPVTEEVIHDILNHKLADKYFCNFSLFQSVPDSWAIDQIFPIVPLTDLHQSPNQRTVLEDLTCDSDGRVNYYVTQNKIEKTLLLPAFSPDKPMHLGIFLVGAYQEILGDMHNLFGDTDSVHVILNEKNEYQLDCPMKGDTADALLRYVHFDSGELLANYQNAIQNAHLNPKEALAFEEAFVSALNGSTYLED